MFQIHSNIFFFSLFLLKRLKSKDIISDIVIRLPAKSIGWCRCISKAWYKLLKGSEFVKMHLNHANEMI